MADALVKNSVFGLLLTCASTAIAQADVLGDSHLTLGLRNFWNDRDYKQDDAPRSRTGSWSQGFDLQFKSGYSDSPIQFGLDVGARVAYRLDGSAARSPDGVLPQESNGSPVRDYGRANATLKMKYSNTELKVGELLPALPVAYYDPTRQLLTTYQGAMLESREVTDLTLTGGRIWSISGRESSNRDDLHLFGDSDDLSSDGMSFAGLNYLFTPKLSATYFFSELDDIYRQNFLGITYKTGLPNGYSLKVDGRYYDNNEAGKALSGSVDNHTYGGMVSVGKGAHTVGLGYQRMLGQDIFPTLNSYAPAPYLVNWGALGFVKPGERSWQMRYDYDFTNAGIPGLKWTAWWMVGNGINLGTQNRETERVSILTYVVQNGALKGFGVNWLNVGADTNNGAKYEDNRVALTYLVTIW